MDYFPAFIKVKGKSVLVVGGTEDALHKVRLLRKSSAHIIIFGDVTEPTLRQWIDNGTLPHAARMVTAMDIDGAAFAYIGTDDPHMRDAAMALFSEYALPFSVIDDKARSSFITPALVDRDPVVVAIGTEGTGPIIARDIKARIEAELSPLTGIIAKVAGVFRPRVDHLPLGGPRRRFWQRYLDDVVPAVIAAAPDNPEYHLKAGLEHLLAEDDILNTAPAAASAAISISPRAIHVVTTSAGRADHLTRRAHAMLHDADIILHHHRTPQDMLELTRRESLKYAWGYTNDYTNDYAGEHIRDHNGGHKAGIDAVIQRDALAAARSGQSVVIMTPDDSLPIPEADIASVGLALDYAPYVTPAINTPVNARPNMPASSNRRVS